MPPRQHSTSSFHSGHHVPPAPRPQGHHTPPGPHGYHHTPHHPPRPRHHRRPDHGGCLTILIGIVIAAALLIWFLS